MNGPPDHEPKVGEVRRQVEEYITLRRGLGYRSRAPERLLRGFADTLDAAGHRGPIGLEASLAWAAATTSTDPHHPSRRLTVIRGFLRHLSALDGATQVPAPGLLGPSFRRTQPHVYSDAEIANLMAAAFGLDRFDRLRPHCYATLFGLLACTGLRIAEALALSIEDVDLTAGMLTVRAGKRGRTRWVPLHPTALGPLRHYAARRARYPGTAFFRTDRSDHISYNTANHTFRLLRRQLGWTAQGRTRLPRIHDLRHRFVVRRIQAWHADGVDVDAKIPALATYLGHVQVSDVYWYLSAVPELMDIISARFASYADVNPRRRRTAGTAMTGPRTSVGTDAGTVGFPVLVQDFFLRRLVQQRGASARTVESYRDAMRLLITFAEQRTGKPPSALVLADLDAPLVLDFLDHLESDRRNSVRTRNARLAAIHSFIHYASLRDPTTAVIAGRVLAIPAKRLDQPVLGYLTRDQIAAILAAPDRSTWSGHRDAVMLTTLYNTGARVAEITGLRRQDVLLDRQTAVHLHGKGRKERVLPLWKNTAAQLRDWLQKANPRPRPPSFRIASASP